MQIAEIFQNEPHPILSFEIFPPKRESALKNIDETLRVLTSLHPDFISVTFGAGGSVTNSATVDIASKIKNDYHIEALVHLTCLSYSKDEILTMLANLKASGISNVLALRGDNNPNLPPKKEFCHASDLVEFVKAHSDLGISAACYPETHQESRNQIEDIKHLKFKVDAGAQHLISQLFFDNEVFYDFVEKARIAGIDVPISAGVMPVINKAQIERMITLCGAKIPPRLQRILDHFGDDKEAMFDAGMNYAINQIVELISNGVEGIHVYTMNNPVVATRICNEIKNLIRCK